MYVQLIKIGEKMFNQEIGKREREFWPLYPVENMGALGKRTKAEAEEFRVPSRTSSSLTSCASDIPPATPKKRTTSRRLYATPKPVSPYEKLNKSLADGEFEFDVTQYHKGSYSNVYKVHENRRIIEDVDNSEILFKAFHGENTGFDQKKLDGYLANEIANYNKIKNLELPVAKIYNLDQVTEKRYIIQEFIPDSIDLYSQAQSEQIRAFFRASVENTIVMDLQPQNFRVKNGNVYLVDFIEEIEADDYTIEEVHLFNKKAISAWFCEFINIGHSKAQAVGLLVGLTGYSEEEINEIDEISSYGMKINPLY